MYTGVLLCFLFFPVAPWQMTRSREIIRFKVKLSTRRRVEKMERDPSGCFSPFWFRAEVAAFVLDKEDNKRSLIEKETYEGEGEDRKRANKAK